MRGEGNLRARDFDFPAFSVFDSGNVDGSPRNSQWLYGQDAWSMAVGEFCAREVVCSSGNMVVECYVDGAWSVSERYDARAPNIRC